MYNSVIVFDTESTGGGNTCDIVELGAVKVVGTEIIAEYHERFCSDKPVNSHVAAITGITDHSVGMPPKDGLQKFLEFSGENVLYVGHNLKVFDIPLLERICKEQGLQLPKFRIYDTILQMRADLSGNKYPNFRVAQETKHSLSKGVLTNLTAACAHYQINHNLEYHRALTDAKITHKVFTRQIALNNYFIRINQPTV